MRLYPTGEKKRRSGGTLLPGYTVKEEVWRPKGNIG